MIIFQGFLHGAKHTVHLSLNTNTYLHGWGEYQHQPKLAVIYKDKDKDLFIGPQEFVVGYSKAPEQPQSSARPICHSHAMTRTGREPVTLRIAA